MFHKINNDYCVESEHKNKIPTYREQEDNVLAGTEIIAEKNGKFISITYSKAVTEFKEK